MSYQRPDGSVLHFTSSPASFGDSGAGSPQVGPFLGAGTATLTNNGNGTYTVREEDSKAIIFDSVGNLLSIKDVSGIGWILAHPDANTTVVTHTNGSSYKVALVSGSMNTYGAAKQINVTDPAGNVYVYQSTVSINDSYYDPVSHIGIIQSEALPGSPATTIAYKYLPDNSATASYAQWSEVDYNGVAHDVTTYDSAGRANMSSMADGTQKTDIVYGINSTGLTVAVTNPLGHVSVYQYNSSQLLVSVTGDASSLCAGSFAQNTYDANGNLATSTDNNGNATKYVYAANGLLQQRIEAAGTAVQRTTDYTWDASPGTDRPLSIKVEGLSEADFTYDSHNRLASQAMKNLSAVGTAQQVLTTTYTYTYYANGIVDTQSVARPSPSGSNTDVYTYDTLGNLAMIADGLGHAATYSNYNLLGEPGQVSGSNGDVTNYSYDARGRITSIVRHPNGVAATWTYSYDGFGLPSGVTAPDNAASSIIRNAYMQVTSLTHNDKDGTSSEGFAYDANGDVVIHTVARGGDIGVEQKTTYDELGRVHQRQGMHGQTLTYAYDVDDNLVSVTDALGHVNKYQYDAFNRVTQSIDPNGGITKSTYDLANHVSTVTDPRGLVTAYTYDGLGQLWSQSSPDTGNTTFAYDAYGRRSSLTRADGVLTTYGYDTLNRATSVSAGGLTQSVAYDSCTHGIGRLCSASDANGTTSYSYTPEGWLTGRGFSIGGATYALGYGYDSVGHVASVAYPDGNSAAYSYTNGVVSGVTFTTGGVTVSAASAVTYRPGDVAMASWTSRNGLVNTLSYDSDGRLGSISVPGVQSLAFTYDAANRITQIANGLDGSMTETLGYDALSHLTTETSGADNESYSYDAAGNRMHQVVNGNATTFSMAATSNRLVTLSGAMNAAWGYDAEGAMTTASGTVVYRYDPFRRLIKANGTSYVVGPEGQRLRKTGGAGSTYFAPDRTGTLLAEDQNGTWLDYVWLNGRLVAAIANGGVYPVHADQTGRPMAVTDANGPAVVWQTQTLPFTSQVKTNVWRTFSLGFPGQYHDDESGLWHNGVRDYNPYIGRYVESDPIGLAGGVNTYAYVG
ncbi:MAG: RHS repeat-associated core domain-containing protein, partial [Rhodanobacter sp.]